MQRPLKKQTSKRIVLKTIVIFLGSYLIFLILWIQVKDYYGYTVTFITSELMPLIKDVHFEEMREEKGMIQATFSRPVMRQVDLLIDIPIKTSSYTFNVPLTFGIMAALFPFIRKRWKAYGEALFILFGVHLLYVFSLEANSLTTVFVERGLDAASKPRLLAYQFLWEFTNNMVIRFEPFLIGFYIFIRFRK
ncbi:MAG: exosortase H-associated membrane protein [Thermodesulfobacteriota bacterium]